MCFEMPRCSSCSETSQCKTPVFQPEPSQSLFKNFSPSTPWHSEENTVSTDPRSPPQQPVDESAIPDQDELCVPQPAGLRLFDRDDQPFIATPV